MRGRTSHRGSAATGAARPTSPAPPAGPDRPVLGTTGTSDYARWMRERWDRVTIDDLRLCRIETAGAPRLHACAEVELGELLPADVHVTLRRASPPPGAGDGAEEHAMFAETSLHNDRFLFATELPDEPLAGEAGWVVRVDAARPLPGTVQLPPVEWRFTLRDGAASGAP